MIDVEYFALRDTLFPNVHVCTYPGQCSFTSRYEFAFGTHDPYLPSTCTIHRISGQTNLSLSQLLMLAPNMLCMLLVYTTIHETPLHSTLSPASGVDGLLQLYMKLPYTLLSHLRAVSTACSQSCSANRTFIFSIRGGRNPG